MVTHDLDHAPKSVLAPLGEQFLPDAGRHREGEALTGTLLVGTLLVGHRFEHAEQYQLGEVSRAAGREQHPLDSQDEWERQRGGSEYRGELRHPRTRQPPQYCHPVGRRHHRIGARIRGR
ncbi:hypothetical protein ABUW04_24410 [Streptacidiphilus sp. N1-10]|uniref:Uncharacterized protein n=1 Tax=Streptacidiphilus jeojiensis TaxID=3229225 RepID=A0ABV6XTA7_9ACTN